MLYASVMPQIIMRTLFKGHQSLVLRHQNSVERFWGLHFPSADYINKNLQIKEIYVTKS